jgi:glycosyltransferase involved in cell wall biosynthesis
MTKRASLAVAMIVRNEARSITRCLESVRPWVDRMVVLDTGSRDNTRELARAAGADVYEMAWPGSFAQARNRSLELADADWNLIIDADEWIESGGENLRPWCQTPNRLGSVCVHSACMMSRGRDGEKVPSETLNWITRVIPRGARFERRVHEQVASTLPRTRIDIHLGHDGYLDEQMVTKKGRNRKLLLLDLKERPGDPYILYQLGKESESRQDYKKACQFYRQSLATSHDRANWKHSLVIRYLFCLGQCGEFSTAFAYIQENMARWEGSPDFFYMVGNLALDQAKADQANALSEWIPLAVTAWGRCLEIGDQPALEGSVDGVGSYLAETNLDAIGTALGIGGNFRAMSTRPYPLERAAI